MALQLDATAFGALTKLLDKVTDKHESHQDAVALQQIKAFCKQSDENITWLSTVLLHRLKEDHAQTRLHVVNLADQLFQRSKAFRTHWTAHFTEFLELSLGFRRDKPLPGPASTANQLRERALEVVEQWNDKFASSYKQVAIGFNYLKHNMAMRFPEVRARAAAAEAEAQERNARTQAQVQDKYRHIRSGFDGHMGDMRASLTQIAEGFVIVEGTIEQAPSSLVQGKSELPDEEIAWELVEEPAPAAEASSSAAEHATEGNAGDEGLSAYAMDTIPEDLLQQASAMPSSVWGGVDRTWVSLKNPDRAVVETLQELDKAVVSSHLPRLQEWLKIFVRVDAGEIGSGAHAELERTLRVSIDLQTQLKQSHQKLESLSQQLASLPAGEAGSAMSDEVQPSGNGALGSGERKSGPRDARPVPGDGGADAGTICTDPKQQSALMERLFGSDDDSGDDNKDNSNVSVQRQEAEAPQASGQLPKEASSVQESAVARVGTAADVPLNFLTDRDAIPFGGDNQAGLGAESGNKISISRNLTDSSSLGQRLVDPTAPKRAISFSNSARHRQSTSAKRRTEAFNAAADAAINQALAQRAATEDTQASDLASQSAQDAAVVKPEADASTTITLGRQQPSHVSHVTAVVQPEQATDVTVRQASGTQDLPTGRTQTWGPTDPAGAAQGVQEEEQDAPRLITRTSEAEVAPKLKVGSRLAASMAKLAAAKKAGKPQPDAAPSAAAVPNLPKEGGKMSTIPDDVKRALLAKAPVVAPGNDLVYWDSTNARALVNARGMEYQNHWGAHDPDVELPSEQLNAFFGTRAEYWMPSAKAQAPQRHPQQPPGHPHQAAGHPKPSAGLSHDQAGPQRVAGGAGGKEASAPDAASQVRSLIGNVRAQRAADRAHNEAVIASTDEQVAQALADEEAQAVVKATSGQGRGAKRKPQPTVRERLAKKLLSGKARGATVGEIQSAADERFQEVNSNRWQATRFP